MRDGKPGIVTTAHLLMDGMLAYQPDWIKTPLEPTGLRPRKIGMVTKCVEDDNMDAAWIELDEGVEGMQGLIADAEGLRKLNFTAVTPGKWTVPMMASSMFLLQLPEGKNRKLFYLTMRAIKNINEFLDDGKSTSIGNKDKWATEN